MKIEASDNGCVVEAGGFGCLGLILVILVLWALWFGLPTTWGTLHIDIIPPSVKLEKEIK